VCHAPSTVTARSSSGRWVGALLTSVLLSGAITACAASDSVPVMSLQVGDCVSLNLPFQSAELDRVRRVSCDGPHSAEVLHAGELNPDQNLPYPGDELGLFLEVLAACVKPPAPGRRSVFEERTGQPYSATSAEVVPVAPDLRTWQQAGGKFLCLMLTGAGSSRV
jgi:hypothetical protein